MRALLMALSLLAAAPLAVAQAPLPQAAPFSLTDPPPAALPYAVELDARSIVARATEAAGGEAWRRPQTLHLKGHAVFYDGAKAVVNERHEMWRVYPAWKADAHKADGKVRIESWRAGQQVLLTSFDGQRTYNQNGPLPPSEADRQWAENFGFGVIRYALDEGYSLTRLPDDLVDGRPAFVVEVTDPAGGKTQFAIGQFQYEVLRVGFATPRGWHERIYSEFYRKPGEVWVQPMRIRLFYNGVKQNELFWTDYAVNVAMPDDLFAIAAKAP